MKLSILVATTSARTAMFTPLKAEIERQMSYHPGQVELIVNEHETDCVGKKRNDLLDMATGSHVVFIDSDDAIPPYYVAKILPIIEHVNPDCIGINGVITFNGGNARKWYISKDYRGWYEENEEYFRTPNHISPVRRELALMVGFPEVSFGEDFSFSKRLHSLLRQEAKIDEPMYFYHYISHK